MKKILFVAAAVILILSSFIARSGSTGKKLLDTGRGYIHNLAAGQTLQAYSFLSDSLAEFLSPDILSLLEDAPSSGSIRAGRIERRGFTLFISLDDGGSRTLWLRSESDGRWTVAGDTSLDNVLGGAIVLCSSYAKETVIPAISDSGTPGDYFCPVCGSAYYLEGGYLLCPAGHLGDGLDAGGSVCGILRDSLSTLIYDYVSSGYEYPSSFGEMFELSEGSFSQRGGFRCPDDGYSYFEITADGVYCPFHRKTSYIETPVITESYDSTSSI